jgi:hypothetical protein
MAAAPVKPARRRKPKAALTPDQLIVTGKEGRIRLIEKKSPRALPRKPPLPDR